MVWIAFDTAPEDVKWQVLTFGLLALPVFSLAGRSVFMWAQKRMLKQIASLEMAGIGPETQSGYWGIIYAACGLGVVLGPLLARVISGDTAFVLGLVAFNAFMTGWGLAPDLMEPVRRKGWGQEARS